MTSGLESRGRVYLVASSQGDTLKNMAARALASVARRPARVALSYAAAEGADVERIARTAGALFPGAETHRFSVEGEKRATSPEKARAIVDDADVIFFSGGDPVLGARLLVNAGADAWVRDARARGAQCIGVSAGAIMLCAWWAEWPQHGAPEQAAAHDGGELVACMRVVDDLVVDCHAEDDGWNELTLVRAMLRDRRGAVGTQPRLVGIPSGAAVIVEADGAIEGVVGEPFRLK